jgi:predicted MPP superfamily phosphohydrolase
MRSLTGVAVFLLILLLLDFYVYTALRSMTAGASHRVRVTVIVAYFSVTLLSIALTLYIFLTHQGGPVNTIRMYLFATMIGLFFAKILASIFLLIDDIRRLFQLFWQWVIPPKVLPHAGDALSEPISRSVFMSWLALGAGTTLFGSLLNGFSNKYSYRIVRKKLLFSNLPASFKGMKLVHISDIHSGSFTDPNAVKKGLGLIMQQNADLILFTGDLVNDRALEMEPFIEMFAKLRAPLGVFATLGNHDYGDYVPWPINGLTKEENHEQLKNVFRQMGWKLLMNEHVVLEKNGEQVALLGIENWSNKARFPKYGKLDQAYASTEKYPFKILMSHDPSHWHAQVRPDYPDIDLTLSGHTHGMQFGVEIPGFQWSPVQYVYKEWAGLYEDGPAKLYVNRGFGFIGYPGRVGVLPEITVIELG